jgi:hypothetical protein
MAVVVAAADVVGADLVAAEQFPGSAAPLSAAALAFAFAFLPLPFLFLVPAFVASAGADACCFRSSIKPTITGDFCRNSIIPVFCSEKPSAESASLVSLLLPLRSTKPDLVVGCRNLSSLCSASGSSKR